MGKALPALAAAITLAGAGAQAEPLSAAASDPAKLGWMTGAPPPADKLIRAEDGGYYRFPKTRWSFSHFREFLPTTNVCRGPGRPHVFPRAERADLDQVAFVPLGGGAPMTISYRKSSTTTNFTSTTASIASARQITVSRETFTTAFSRQAYIQILFRR